jgi:hypothetical protein
MEELPMSAAEIAAYLGAAAWLPQIGRVIYRGFVRPVVTIVPEQYAEIGFTSFGPILNLRMAFSAGRKGAIIDGFDLLLRHVDGETRTLRWSGLTETFSQITDQAGNRQFVTREQSPIALQVGTESLVEKFVRFQEPRYHETVRPPLLRLVAHFKFLKEKGDPNYVDNALASEELHNLVEARQKSFWWRPGRYGIEFRLTSPKKILATKSRYSFELTALEIDQLQENVETLKADLENLLRSNKPDFEAVPLNWNWVNVEVRKQT